MSDVTENKARHRLDELDGELNELYRQVSEKESERERYDRIVNPDDYDEE